MRLIWISLFLLGVIACYGQEQYSRVKIDLSEVSMHTLAGLGIETDHGLLEPGVHFVHVFSDRELALMDQRSIPYYVLVPDVQRAYHEHQDGHAYHSSPRSAECIPIMDELYQYDTPANYSYGSMGGYLTYAEMLVELDSMRMLYPDLITMRAPVGAVKTWDGNDIWWLRISDNADVDEGEPEILYTALHHAREPNSLSQMIFYMWYLLENYETDDEVRYLVDHSAMYFMPCLNPDGYIYNEVTDPDGGGFWRKNRRPATTPDSIGVDLNRNYGFEWGFDNQGSSPNATSNTYRGPAPFSEPETQAVRDFAIEHKFQIALNYHTFGNLLIHPWGFDDAPTEEDSLFKAMGRAMIRENEAVLGTGTETVGYIVNGDSDDYLYGEEGEKDKIYSLTPEVGFTFWPNREDIDQLNKSAMLQNLAAAHCLHNFYDSRVEDLAETTQSRTGTMTLHVTKAGLAAGEALVQVVSTSPHLSILDPSHSINLNAPEDQYITVAYEISEDAAPIETLTFDVVTDNGGVVLSDSYQFEYRNSINEVLWADALDGSSGIDLSAGSWSYTEEDFVSSPSSLTDSEGGPYDNGASNVVVIAEDIDLTEVDLPRLEFMAKWDIERRFDHCRVQASTDGVSWTSLCGRYTTMGLESHGTDDPLYDGKQDWVSETMDLSDYAGEQISLRMVLTSDQFVRLDGFYIDDVAVVNEIFIATSTDDPKDAMSSFDIYPTVSGGSFTVEVAEHEDLSAAKISILNSNGVTLKSLKNIQHRQSIHLDLPSGNYFVKYTTGNEYSVRQISIQR